MKKPRWGVLSTARIAREKVIPAIQKSRHGRVVAIASRSAGRARAVADSLGIEASYGSYEALLDSPEVDAVYIPLPNHMHVDWAIHCIEAGKHVLCEKPLGLHEADARRLDKAAGMRPDLVATEAFMYRYHPQWQVARQTAESGAIGVLRVVHAFFSYYNVDPANIRNQAAIGGGALMDIGCYGIAVARFLFGREPIRACAISQEDPAFATDRLTSALLDFGEGSATFSCATQLHRYQRVQILGDAGRIEIEIPFNAPPDHATRIWLETASGRETITFEATDQYALQADAFAEAVFGSCDAVPALEDAVRNMRVIDAVAESARRASWIRI